MNVYYCYAAYGGHVTVTVAQGATVDKKRFVAEWTACHSSGTVRWCVRMFITVGPVKEL